MSPLSVTQRDDTYVCADCGWRTGLDETPLRNRQYGASDPTPRQNGTQDR